LKYDSVGDIKANPEALPLHKQVVWRMDMHLHLQLRKRVMKSWGLSCIDGFAKRDLEELLQEHGFSCD